MYAHFYLTPEQDDYNQELRVCLTTEARRHTRYPYWPTARPGNRSPGRLVKQPVKTVRRQLCIPYSVLDVAMTQVRLNRPRVRGPVSQVIATGVSQLMGMHRKRDLR